MKNSNLFKKFAVMVVSAMMVMTTFAMPTFAATNATIGGLEEGVTPTAYKIANVTATGGIERIKDDDDNDIVTSDMVRDFEDMQTSEILKLAANTPSELDSVEGSVTGTVATIPNLDPGIYLVKFAATSNVKTIYNPVIISVDKDGKVKSGVIGKEGDALENYGEAAQVKKSTIPFEKVVERSSDKLEDTSDANVANSYTLNEDAKVNADPQDGVDGNRGDTAAKGQTVQFRINTEVPYYADNFFTDTEGTTVKVAPQFQVYDDLNGLTLDPNSVVVYGNNDFENALEVATATEAKDYSIEIKEDAKGNAVGFEIKLSEAAIKNLRGQALEVRYAAVVNDNAERVNFNPDTNTAGCKYSNNPNSNQLAELDKRTTYHYKFTINGRIQGDKGEWNREVIKVGLNEATGQIIYEETDGHMTQHGWQPLDGVTFKLYNADKTKVVCDNVYSANGGVLMGMEQLDAGVYYLVEDQEQAAFKTGGAYAENNYVANTNPIKIEIKAKLLDDGRLDSYQVLVEGECVGNYKANYTTAYDLTPGTKVKDIAGSFYEVDGKDVGAGVQIPDKHGIYNPDNVAQTGDWAGDYGIAADIVNTKIGTLPSTGGIGTVVFTVGGIAIMALALFLLFGAKKKEQE